MTSSTYDWKARHASARQEPLNATERWVVRLLDGIEAAVDSYEAAHADAFPDGVISEAFGQVIAGARELLNADFGTRLDGGSMHAELCDLAERVRYDLDDQEVVWDGAVRKHTRPALGDRQKGDG